MAAKLEGEGRRYAHQERQKCRPYLATDSALHMLGGGPMGKIVLAESTGQSSSPGSQASPDSSREDKGTGMEEKVISGRDSLTFVIVPKNV